MNPRERRGTEARPSCSRVELKIGNYKSTLLQPRDEVPEGNLVGFLNVFHVVWLAVGKLFMC